MSSLSLIKPYFSEKKLVLILGLISLIIVDVLQLLIPRVIKLVVDDITAMDVSQISLLIYALYITGIVIFMGIFRYIWRSCLIGTSRRVEEGLRNELFGHLQGLSASYFDQVKTGDLMARATNDIQQVRMATGMGLVALNDALFLGCAAVGFMLYIQVELTLYVLIPMPLIVVGTRFFTKKLHHRYQKVQAKFSDMTEEVREKFAGIRLIKAYNLEPLAYHNFNHVSQKYIQSNLDLVKSTAAFFPMMLLFTNLSLAVVLYFGGSQTILGAITPGDFAAFINYLGLLTWPMMAMGWVINLLQRGKASLDRIEGILETEPEIVDPKDPVSLKKDDRIQIDFQEVSFRFPGSRGSVLEEIDLSLKPGQTLGVIGPAGSGKSALIQLIPRIYEATQGRIFINQEDIRNIPINQLRSLISFLAQEPFLFAATVKENITFGRDVSEKELKEAVEKAALLETISSFPHGFETYIGEKGIILSGGQKQRLALARAILQDKPVFLLDDPISQVDLETGQIIVDTLRKELQNKTGILASHRLSAVQFADLIITLDKGRIIESGTHQELLSKGGYYSRTYQMQQIEEELNVF